MTKLSKRELKISFALSGVLGLRIFGLFLITPVLTAYALNLPGATPFLVGLAAGVYGFAQAALQVPAGLLSDRIGRHWVITTGLLVFAIGSITAAMAQGIGGVITGRVLQGMGVVSGSIQALAADHSHDDNRSKVMAIIGVGIGLAVIMAIILGAPLVTIAGLPGLFAFSALLSLLAIVLLWTVVPRSVSHHVFSAKYDGKLRGVLLNPPLLILNISVFMMNAMLTAAFVAMPLLLERQLDMPLHQQWQLYLPVMLLSALVMVGLLRRVTSVTSSLHMIFLCALGMGLALYGFSIAGRSHALLWGVATLFFIAFNLLEGILPSLVSRLAPQRVRGATLGAYATSQFLGAGVGGVLGGLVLQNLGLSSVFAMAAALTLVWLPLLWWCRSMVMMPQHK